jgi:AraC-like DNA-binding protein
MLHITGTFTQILLAWMQRQGLSNSALSSELQLLSRKESISAERWISLLDQAKALSSCPHVGLQIGEQVQVRHVGVLGYLVLNSPTLADALETYLLCERHFYSVHFAELERAETHWTLSWPNYLGARSALFSEVSFAALVTFVRQRFPGGCQLLAVALPGEAPPDSSAYEQFFACPVSFGAEQPGISFAAADLHRSVQGPLSGDFQTMRSQQLQAFSSVINIGDPFLQRLQHILLQLIPIGNVSLPEVAAALHCSVRSVQRKLGLYQLSYQALLDGLREQLARRYLLRTPLSLADIALLLGFSDQSAFNRAFKGWTGLSPGKFRQTPERPRAPQPPLT